MKKLLLIVSTSLALLFAGCDKNYQSSFKTSDGEVIERIHDQNNGKYSVTVSYLVDDEKKEYRIGRYISTDSSLYRKTEAGDDVTVYYNADTGNVGSVTPK